MKVNILGTKYQILFCKDEDDSKIKKMSASIFFT